MQGRLEHELQFNNSTTRLLEQMPSYVTDYYYMLQVSKEPTTCNAYIHKIKHFMDYLDEQNIDISEINDVIIGQYFNRIKYKNKNNKMEKTSYAYQKMVWSTLNLFFNYLNRKNIIQGNPLVLIDRPSQKDYVKRKFLSMDDLRAILKCVDQSAVSQTPHQKLFINRDKLILTLFMTTGMRKTALSEINIEDISFKEKTIVVTDKRSKTQVYGMSKQLEFLIQQWLYYRQIILQGKSCDALFITSNGNRVHVNTIAKIVKKYTSKALGYDIPPHKLRAAFISLYYEASGGDIEATKEAVGHSNISTTSIYITQRNDARKEAMKFMTNGLNI